MFRHVRYGLSSVIEPQMCFDPATLTLIATTAASAASSVGTAAASVGTALSSVAPIATIASAGLGAAGAISAGKAQQTAARYEAQQLEMKGKEERAAAQRQAEEYGRRKELALSAGQARAAAGGFSATDPTALAIADEISRYGTMQEQMAMYGGESRARGMEAQAAGRIMEGKAAMSGARSKALATILGGIGDLGMKYRPPAGGGGATYKYG